MSDNKKEVRQGADGTLEQGDFKLKKPAKKRGRPKKLNKTDDSVVKVDLNKKEENAIQEPETTKAVLQSSEQSEEKREETKVGLQEVGDSHEKEEPTEQNKEEIKSPIVEISNEEDNTIEPLVEKPQLPENVEKLVDFMKETGGTMEDYIRLNTDYSDVNNDVLLREYYNKTKPHLDQEEIDFILEDKFSWDEDVEEERAVKIKKLAYKEEIAKAKNFLEDMKDKYYDEIKLRSSNNNPEMTKAMDFFNRYNEEQQIAKERHDKFTSNTKKFFNDKFEGFEFNVGEKKFRYNVNNKENVANSQSNLKNFVEKFFDKNGDLKNYNDYHKAIYTAENADTMANHFYEQGKADAIKDMMAKSKNIDNSPRATSTGDVFINGLKVKAISGVDSSKLKLRINKNK
mgnify:CR=1 FL=1